MPTEPSHLSQLLDRAADRWPGSVAVEDERGRTLTFAELGRLADRLATRLARWGIGRGDRVGLWLPKGIEAVAAVHGILRSGAAYVPIDPTAPAARGATILADARVRAVVAAGPLPDWAGPGPTPRLITVEAGSTPDAASWADIQADAAPPPLPSPHRGDDLAYILYTSGSTGTPKGVMLTHTNAFCFLDWCARTFDLRPGDRFASHAPFHFDLSVFDLYASCRAGGTLVLIGESLGKDPARLGPFVGDRRIDVWYSAPSILALLADRGGLAAPAPRLVLFAGEVFPIRPLRRLRDLWPASSFWNLYGPTETNVCTASPIPATIPADRTEPYPIGHVCPPLRARVVDGELQVAGPGVMRGYFGRPDLTAAAFALDPDGTAWYRTGDLVADDGTDCLSFRGRRDRMVKKRGYRIELGEVESALHRHDDVARAAVVARADESGTTLTAFVAMKPGRKASIIAMKRHCSLYLPHYMVPDSVAFLPALPSTSTDKVDYQGLRRLADGNE